MKFKKPEDFITWKRLSKARKEIEKLVDIIMNPPKSIKLKNGLIIDSHAPEKLDNEITPERMFYLSNILYRAKSHMI